MICSTVAALGAVTAICATAPSLPLSSLAAVDEARVGAAASYVTRANDTLLDVAQRYDLGYTQLIAANRELDPWLPGAGRHVVVPDFYILPDAPHTGIVVNLAEQRLFYFPPDGGPVQTFPIGIGVEAAVTPLGVTRVVAKEKAPVWYPPVSIRAEKPDLPAFVPAGPGNPLGAYALRLGWQNYLIHGTNKPDGIGRSVSHGCLHLYPADIEELFHEVPVGTSVRVVNQRAELAWIDGQLFLEVHPSHAEADALDIGENPPQRLPRDLMARVTAAAGAQIKQVDWAAVTRAGLAETGIPTPILRHAGGALHAVSGTPPSVGIAALSPQGAFHAKV